MITGTFRIPEPAPVIDAMSPNEPIHVPARYWGPVTAWDADREPGPLGNSSQSALPSSQTIMSVAPEELETGCCNQLSGPLPIKYPARYAYPRRSAA